MIKVTHWCIKRTPETANNINKWFSSLGKRKFSAKTDFHRGWGQNKSYWSYLHYPEHNGKYLHDDKIRGYTEITYDEFKKYILTKQIKLLKDKSGFQDYIYRPEQPKKDGKNKILKQKETSKKTV